MINTETQLQAIPYTNVAPSPLKQGKNQEQTNMSSEITDRVEISDEGIAAYKSENSKENKKTEDSKEELTEEEKKKVEELKKRDKEVRDHEQAHLAAAGGLAVGPAKYEYEQGPDGKRYAKSGEVPLSVSEGKTPEETIQKAEQVKRAALAPNEPSSTDRKVANQADGMIAKAKQELAKSEQDNFTNSLSSGMLVNTVA